METTTAPTLSFDEALEGYVKTVNALQEEYCRTNFPDSTVIKPAKIELISGSRYVKVVKVDSHGGSRSVHTFIDKTNGDILKGTWKAPVKNGVRGNIYKDNYPKCINWHGAEYLR